MSVRQRRLLDAVNKTTQGELACASSIRVIVYTSLYGAEGRDNKARWFHTVTMN
jgi:hypothetical protein